MNKVVLIGRLTKDPELRFTPGKGVAVTNFTLAVDRKIKIEGKQQVDFINILTWNKIAENVASYLRKGKLVAIGGGIETRSYEAKDGTRRYVTEVVADEVQFLEKSSTTIEQTLTQEYSQCDDEDIPF
ncbi:MAG: single-stranded DNA-binding protein [Clostridium sp.]